jgi:hypothetical protein
MKRKYQRTLELIFSRPVSGSLPWRDIEALFFELGGDVSERAGSPRPRNWCKSLGLSPGVAGAERPHL